MDFFLVLLSSEYTNKMYFTLAEGLSKLGFGVHSFNVVMLWILLCNGIFNIVVNNFL